MHHFVGIAKIDKIGIRSKYVYMPDGLNRNFAGGRVLISTKITIKGARPAWPHWPCSDCGLHL